MTLAEVVARNYYFVKRLHSLLAIIPLAVFLFEHLMINSLAAHGPSAFNGASHVLRSLPYLILIELVVIIIPLYIHGLLGLWITLTGSVEARVPYLRNWLYLLQRATGIVVILFVTYHIIYTRIWATYVRPTEDLFQLMHDYLQNPLVFAIYVIGVGSASFHLGNGLFNFLYKWGITVGERAQMWTQSLSWFVMAAFFGMGLVSLISFATGG